jgi:protein-S-isoprenylcysteine O-methyltransferase Ste14
MSGTTTLRLGQALFRFRSFTPLPVLAALAFVLYRTRGTPGPGGPQLDGALDAAGLAVAALGQALRFYTLGWVPEGTSGQRSELEAWVLNTKGPYAYVRNPLYLGNLGICLGLLLLAHAPLAYAIGLAFFFGEYFFIIRAEEDFLRQRFGQAFDAYRAQVRRWVPRLTPAFAGRLREGQLDWGRALKKEHNPFAAWALGALALLAWERYARGAPPASLWAYAALAAAVAVGFVAVKGWKHRWLKRRR